MRTPSNRGALTVGDISPVRYHYIQQGHDSIAMNTRSTPVSEARKPARLSRARRTAILKALADPHRFELLERMARATCPLGCSEVRPALDISAATLSHHIKELEAAGLVQITRAGKFHYLSLKTGVLDALIACLQSLQPERCPGATDRDRS